MNLTNPKIALFFLAFLPQFLGTATNPALQLLVLGVLLQVSGLAADLLIGWAATWDQPRPVDLLPGGRTGARRRLDDGCHRPQEPCLVRCPTRHPAGRRSQRKPSPLRRLSAFAPCWRPARGRVGLMQLRDPAHLVSPRAIVFWTVRAVPGWLLLLAGQALWFLVSPDHVALRVAALALTVLFATAHLTVMPRWRYRVHRWEVTDNAVYTQSGWLSQERRIAPISRIQTVDIERGPLEQLFRLANVTVTTASAAGPLRIHALDRVTAEGLVAELTEVTSRSDGDAT